MNDVTNVQELINELPRLEMLSGRLGDGDFINMKIICRDPNCKAYNKFTPHIAKDGNKYILVFDLINEE